MNRNTKRIAGLALGAGLLLSTAFFIAWDHKLMLTTYSVASDKVSQKIRILLLTDLHSCVYGEDQRELLDQIDAAAPDLILLAGDILDDEMPHEPGQLVLRALGAAYPCYYVPGNHEHLTGEIDKLLTFIRDCGISVPLGESERFEKNGQVLQICGMDDPIFLGSEAVLAQAKQAKEASAPDPFTILLSHRPELIESLRPLGYDLIVAGHAHGGQWRLPGGKNGLLAPHQGFFPRYSGGEYRFEDSTFIVSRGLARESTRIPRLCNPPELVLIELTPEVQ